MSLTGCVSVLLPEKWDNYYFLDFIVCLEFGQKYCSQHHKYMLISYFAKCFSLEGHDTASHVIK